MNTRASRTVRRDGAGSYNSQSGLSPQPRGPAGGPGDGAGEAPAAGAGQSPAQGLPPLVHHPVMELEVATLSMAGFHLQLLQLVLSHLHLRL